MISCPKLHVTHHIIVNLCYTYDASINDTTNHTPSRTTFNLIPDILQLTTLSTQSSFTSLTYFSPISTSAVPNLRVDPSSMSLRKISTDNSYNHYLADSSICAIVCNNTSQIKVLIIHLLYNLFRSDNTNFILKSAHTNVSMTNQHTVYRL